MVLRILVIISLALLAGCTIHPTGENEERSLANQAGKPFETPVDHRDLPALPDDPSPEELVQHALLTNADVERKYWEWRSAIEQIPQDGTQPTNLVLSANLNISRGSTGLGQAVLGAGNDPMADIVLPPKLSAAGRRALDYARATGLRFRNAQFDVRHKVLDAWLDYALTGELIRLQESEVGLLKSTALVAESRNNTGGGSLANVLKARNELDLSNNDIANMRAQLLAQRAMLNSLLNREPNAALPVPAKLLAARKDDLTDEQMLALAARNNPELAALSQETAGKKEGIMLAKLQYLPDVTVSANTDLKRIAQSLFGAATIPWLRHEAIDAAVAQAEANLRANEAMRRQTQNDLAAHVVFDITTLRDADRQLMLFDEAILPRADQAVIVMRSAYETGHASLLDLLDSQRSLISIRRIIANLRVARAKRLTDLEAITAREIRSVDDVTARKVNMNDVSQTGRRF